MSPIKDSIIVAGHICLDIIIELDTHSKSIDNLLVPGKLLEVGPQIVTGGGVVSNTGLALHRLGIKTRLIGKIGNDIYGNSIIDFLKKINNDLAENVIISPEGFEKPFVVL